MLKLEICVSHQHQNSGTLKGPKRSNLSGLETKLDELRKELSSSHGGIFPHAVLSAQQINMLSTQKPTSTTELEKLIGKVKTEKYGTRIIDLIQQFMNAEEPNGIATTAEGNKNRDVKRPAEGSDNKDNKKRRKNKAVVCIESSEGEDDN